MERNKRKSISGVVTSVSGNKTVKVAYLYKIPHPRYHKEIKRRTVIHAHDEESSCGVGDQVDLKHYATWFEMAVHCPVF